jgi:6-pyruvoyltetrahydropterin/6-carboxytetrahydropterin synthase
MPDDTRPVTISKEFSFSAAHQLVQMPEGHKCRRLHGHSYRVLVALRGPVDPKTGTVLDYADLTRAWEPLAALLDHRMLNEVPGLEVPTAENLAQWVFARLRMTFDHRMDLKLRVRACESASTFAEVGEF